jgi:glycosyltransferase involved in cell wall biosynthesis
MGASQASPVGVRQALPRRRRHLRPVAAPRLRVADVAVFYGGRSGGIRTYLDEKAAYAQRTGAFEHHLIVPCHPPLSGPGRHELPSVPVAGSNGYRWPIGSRPLADALKRLRPDVVLLHDPFWHPHAAIAVAHRVGAAVVMVHHGSVDLDAHAFPGPKRVYRHAFRAWLRRAYAPADAVMAACDPLPDCGREAALRLRFGLHPAFRPQPDEARGDHVLYAGRLGREKGIFELLEAAARSRDPWPLRLVGAGTASDAVAARVRRLGLGDRVSFRPYLADRHELARAYAAARCVVMPGAYETFGLVAFEAAASGAGTVACSTAPSTWLLGDLAHTFPPGDVDALLAAIERARAAEPDRAAATRFAAEHTWAKAFAAELADLGDLAWR